MARLLRMFVSFEVVLMMWLVMAHCSRGAITCKAVVNNLVPCKTYLTQGGSVSTACCKGVKSLNSSANTTADRRTACNCLKSAAKASSVNAKYAASLPTKCNVTVGVAISYNTNCTKYVPLYIYIYIWIFHSSIDIFAACRLV